MPSLEVDDYGVIPVTTLVTFFEESLAAANTIKPTSAIDPPLEEADLEGVLARLPTAFYTSESQDVAASRQERHHRFAVIETAARGILSNLIAQVPIESDDFVKIWNLFDILQCLSDRGQCDPALLVWLLEDLLDSQTIPGCRKIFDYLESRRQRIISKNFNEKKLIILRSCNELLRRLSRAEDTSFSGRVFIFLFQSFPLGDKSSVNLRGEYHTQNVTIYDQDASKPDVAEDKMEVDSEATPAKDGERSGPGKAVSFSDKKEGAPDKPLDADALYPVFWSLQESFNQPKKLFSPEHFGHFKTSLQATMAAFKARPVQQEPKSSKQAEDSKRGLKRKRSSEIDAIVDTFNPKYLTSRDLFELEIGDLSLRRYVLFQALIIMDFLLSLSPKAKEELSSIPQVNKSVAYLDQTLSEEDIKWATAMKTDISKYLLSTTPDGPFFLRLVETVLIRDKNWVRWKIENCPPIELPTVTPQEWAATMKSASSLSLEFLNDEQDAHAVEKLKDPERYQLPELGSFKRKIQEDDLEIDMPLSNDSKAAAIEGKASKTWRALRIASRSKLALFDQIDSYEDINVLFEEKKPEADDEEAHENGDAGDVDQAMDEVKEQDPELVQGNGDSEAAAVSAEAAVAEA